MNIESCVDWQHVFRPIRRQRPPVDAAKLCYSRGAGFQAGGFSALSLPRSPHSLCQPSTRPRPSWANPRWRPHYKVWFFRASKNRLRAGYVSLGHVINRCSCSLHNQDAKESTTLTKITDSFRCVQILLVSFLFSTFNSIFSNAWVTQCKNFNKTHLLSFTLQSGVAMTDHSTRKLDKCNPISQTFRKHISLQDLLQSNTNFYSQLLEVLIAQTTFFTWRFEKSGFYCT